MKPLAEGGWVTTLEDITERRRAEEQWIQIRQYAVERPVKYAPRSRDREADGAGAECDLDRQAILMFQAKSQRLLEFPSPTLPSHPRRRPSLAARGTIIVLWCRTAINRDNPAGSCPV